MHKLCRASIIAVLLTSQVATAQDLGTIGPTYEISEHDLIEVIQSRLRSMEATGELAALQEGYKSKVVDSIEAPPPVHGIRPTERARTFHIDPTWTLDRNAVDEKGNILYPAGTRVNPLNYDRLTKTLLFFDASDERQIEFAARVIAESQMPVKPILVGGEPLKLMRQWKREVFYDQGGALTNRFSIRQSPAVVRQEGNRLRVDEIRL